MVTLDQLTEIAIQASDYRGETQAMAAVSYMERNGLTKAVAVGNFGMQSLPTGMRVRLKAGATFRTTHPKLRGKGPHINQRVRYFSVHDVYQGWIDYHNHDHTNVRNPEVVWVGANGYWFYADINDLEFVLNA